MFNQRPSTLLSLPVYTDTGRVVRMLLFSSILKFAVCLLLFYAKSQSLDRTHRGPYANDVSISWCGILKRWMLFYYPTLLNVFLWTFLRKLVIEDLRKAAQTEWYYLEPGAFLLEGKCRCTSQSVYLKYQALSPRCLLSSQAMTVLWNHIVLHCTCSQLSILADLNVFD